MSHRGAKPFQALEIDSYKSGSQKPGETSKMAIPHNSVPPSDLPTANLSSILLPPFPTDIIRPARLPSAQNQADDVIDAFVVFHFGEDGGTTVSVLNLARGRS